MNNNDGSLLAIYLYAFKRSSIIRVSYNLSNVLIELAEFRQLSHDPFHDEGMANLSRSIGKVKSSNHAFTSVLQALFEADVFPSQSVATIAVEMSTRLSIHRIA